MSRARRRTSPASRFSLRNSPSPSAASIRICAWPRKSSLDLRQPPPYTQDAIPTAMNSEVDAVLQAAETVAWAKLVDRPLCDACLGRLVGKAGHGLTNTERGRTLRQRFQVEAGGPCYLCGDLLVEIDKFADLAAAKLEGWDFHTFLVGSKVDPEVLAREELLWTQLGAPNAEGIKSELNREIGKRLEERFGKPAEFARPDVVAIIDTAFDSVLVEVNPLFIYGRYRKLLRGIPQTRWPCRRCRGKGCDHCGGRGKMYETSVEEVIATPGLAQTGGARGAPPRGGRGEGGPRQPRPRGPPPPPGEEAPPPAGHPRGGGTP